MSATALTLTLTLAPTAAVIAGVLAGQALDRAMRPTPHADPDEPAICAATPDPTDGFQSSQSFADRSGQSSV